MITIGGKRGFALVGVLTVLAVFLVFPSVDGVAAGAAGSVAVGDVFVADTGHNRVVAVSSSGQTTIGSGFNAPRGIAIDAAGNVYVADTGNDRVVKLLADGSAQTTLGSGFKAPRGITVDTSGNVWVADTGNDRVVRMNGDGSGEAKVLIHLSVHNPIGLATDPDGNVYIMYDGWHDRLEYFPGTGVEDEQNGTPSPGGGVAVNPDGGSYMPDTGFDVITNNAGQPPLGVGLKDPEGVSLAANGDIVVADTGNSRVERMAGNGTNQTTVGSGFDHPSGVAVYAPPPTFTAASPPANLLVGEPYSYTFKATAPPGEPTPVIRRRGMGGLPTGVTLDPATGILQGTPLNDSPLNEVGQGYVFNVEAANKATSAVVTVRLSLDPLIFTATSPPSGTVNSPYSYTFAATSTLALTFSATSLFENGDFPPPGLTLDAATGVLSGTPTESGSYQFLLTAANSAGYRKVNVSLRIGAPLPPPTLSITTPGDQASYQSTSVPALEFACTPGSGATLKAGLDGCNAAVDGGAAVTNGAALAAAVGAHTVVVTATDTDGQHASITRNYTVVAGPSASISAPSDGASYAFGSVPDAEFSCTAATGATLRPGTDGCAAAIDGGAPVASGTALAGAAGSHTIVVTATQTDSQHSSVTHAYTVTAGTPAVSLTKPADGTRYVFGTVPDAEFSCTAGTGGTLAAGLAGCSASVDGGAAFADGTALPDAAGDHMIVVTATQTDGQQASVTHAYTVTALAPGAAITTPADGTRYVFGTVPDTEFSCTAGAGGTLAAGLAGCSASVDGGAAFADGTALPGSVGAHSVKVTATQTDGQHSSVTHAYTVTAGTPVVSLTKPAEGTTYAFGTAPEIEFSCTAGAGGTLKSGLDGCAAEVDGGAAVASGTTLAGTVGRHSVAVTATDTDGQATTVAHSYTVTALAPSATITTPRDGASDVFGTVPDAEFSCTAGTGGTLAAGLAGCSASVDGGAAFADGTALPDAAGDHMIVVTATQTDGQQASVTHAYTVTALAPGAAITTPADGTRYVFGTVPDTEFSCTAGAGGTLAAAGLAGCSASVDGGAAFADGTALPGSVGAHSVKVTATQTDGQHSSVTHAYTVTAGTPVVSLTKPAEGTTYAFGTAPEIEFSCTAGAGGTLKSGLDGCAAEVDGGAAVASGTTLAGTVGRHSVAVTATDTDGQATTVAHSYTVTALAPSATITTPRDGASDVFGTVPDAEFSCTAGTGGTLAAGLAGCSASVDGGAAFADGTALPDAAGDHMIVVTATQTDGQQASVSAAYTVVRADSALTAQAARTPLGGTLSVHATLTGAGHALSGRSIAFAAGPTPLCTATTDSRGTATCSLSGAMRAAVLRGGGYEAGFAGDASFRESSATATAVFTVSLPDTRPPANGVLHGVPASTTPGQQLQLSASGFAPHAPVVFGIYSTDKLLARATSDGAGRVTADVRIPADFHGSHTLVATGPDTDFVPLNLEAVTKVSTSAPSSGGSTGGSPSHTGGSGGGSAGVVSGSGSASTLPLAATGPPIAVPLLLEIALGWVLGGAGVLLLARRFRPRHGTR